MLLDSQRSEVNSHAKKTNAGNPGTERAPRRGSSGFHFGSLRRAILRHNCRPLKPRPIPHRKGFELHLRVYDCEILILCSIGCEVENKLSTKARHPTKSGLPVDQLKSNSNRRDTEVSKSICCFIPSQHYLANIKLSHFTVTSSLKSLENCQTCLHLHLENPPL